MFAVSQENHENNDFFLSVWRRLASTASDFFGK